MRVCSIDCERERKREREKIKKQQTELVTVGNVLITDETKTRQKSDDLETDNVEAATQQPKHPKRLIHERTFRGGVSRHLYIEVSCLIESLYQPFG